MKTTVLVACFSNNNGGMELNAMGFAKLLASQHRVFMVCREGSYISTCTEELRQSGVELRAIPFSTNMSWTCVRQTRALLKNLQIKNLLFFGSSELKSLYFATLGLAVRTLIFHGTAKTHSKKDLFHRLIYSRVSFHIAVSERIRQNVLQIIPGATTENVKVIYLPCDDRYEENKKLSVPFHLIHVGRIIEPKGQLVALEAVQSLCDKNIPVSCEFVGGVQDPQYYAQMTDLIAKDSRLSTKVKMVGFSKNVHQHMAEAQFLVFPSQGEGLPNTLIEAFLAKTLPITYDNTVFPELLKMGFVFSQAQDANKQDFFQKVEKTLRIDGETFTKQVESNYALAKKLFSSANILKAYNHLLES